MISFGGFSIVCITRIWDDFCINEEHEKDALGVGRNFLVIASSIVSECLTSSQVSVLILISSSH